LLLLYICGDNPFSTVVLEKCRPRRVCVPVWNINRDLNLGELWCITTCKTFSRPKSDKSRSGGCTQHLSCKQVPTTTIWVRKDGKIDRGKKCRKTCTHTHTHTGSYTLTDIIYVRIVSGKWIISAHELQSSPTYRLTSATVAAVRVRDTAPCYGYYRVIIIITSKWILWTVFFRTNQCKFLRIPG